MVSRRAVLGGAAALLASSAIARPRARAGFFASNRVPIGIQLYTVADLAKADLQGTLQALGRMGYGAVELAGLLGHTPRDWQRQLRRAGLKARSAHVAFDGDAINLGEGAARVADALAPIGIRTAVMSFPPPIAGLERGRDEDFYAYVARLSQITTLDDWRRIADLLNAKGKVLAQGGLRIAYHNHNMELAPRGTTCGLEVLLQETDPALVDFELDAGWIAAAGQDPVDWLARYPGRFRMIHIKDLVAPAAPDFAMQMTAREIGQGSLDWARILPAARAAGVQRYFVEQEAPFVDGRLAAARRNVAYLRQLPAAPEIS
jgi:sugar phosphate isomerase/epimerase